MAEDWDLYAVVRGYKSVANTTTAAETPPTTTDTPFSSEDTLSCLASLTFKEENDPFSFPSLVKSRTNGFQELHQSFIPFTPTTTTTSTSTSGCGINPNSPFPFFSGSTGQEQQQQLQRQTLPIIPTKPHFMPEPSTSAPDRFHDHQQQHPQHAQQPQQQQRQKQNQIQEFQIPQTSSAMTLTNTTQAQSPRSRKRKSQQKKTVCHVTGENLSSDLWAWRKYGQKPIKGSPYPRNYYRCSSSKACAARKQVERSTTEPDMFIVTYTGDHTHPRPTHRNSLAGSTRNKPPTILKSATPGSGSPVNPSNRASSSSPLSPTDLSPTTPSTPPPENEEAPGEPSREAGSPDPEMDMDVASDDDEILIPNMAAMAEDIFVGLHQFDRGYGGGDGEGGSGGGNPAGG